MDISVAKNSDIDEVMELQSKYHINFVSDEDKKDGYVTTLFTKEQLQNLINNESGLFIVRENGVLIAYAMSASWSYWVQWPMFAYMVEGLEDHKVSGQTLTTENSYQYGPICIDKSARGTGVLEKLFDFAKNKMSSRYTFLVTFINKNNPRSFAAHTKKVNLQVLSEFEFNNNNYYQLVADISK